MALNRELLTCIVYSVPVLCSMYSTGTVSFVVRFDFLSTLQFVIYSTAMCYSIQSLPGTVSDSSVFFSLFYCKDT